MTTRELYPNSPLRLVSVELRFPVTRRVATSGIWDRLEDAFGVELPEVEVLMDLNEGIPPRPRPLTPVLVRKSEALDRALTLSFGALRIEFSRYECYEQLRDFLTRAISALDDLPVLSRVSRIGLRYINEIVAPRDGSSTSAASWDKYIRPELFPRLTDIPEPLQESWFTAGMAFQSKGGLERTFVSYGLMPQGTVIEDGPLELEEIDAPCFLLDIDTYERRERREAWADSGVQVLEVLDKLHENVASVFNYCVTEKLRDDVFRVARKRSASNEDDERYEASGGDRE